MDDRQFTVTLAKEDWDLVLTALEICKEDGSSLWSTKSNALFAE